MLSPIQGAPTGKAGVIANDIITHVDDEATQGMTQGSPIAVVPMSSHEFFVGGGEHTRIAFEQDVSGSTGLVLNPGPLQIKGQRIN